MILPQTMWSPGIRIPIFAILVAAAWFTLSRPATSQHGGIQDLLPRTSQLPLHQSPDIDYRALEAPSPHIKPRHLRIKFLNHHWGTVSELQSVTRALSLRHGVNITFSESMGVFEHTNRHRVSKQDALEYANSAHARAECDVDAFDLMVVGDIMALIRPHLESCCRLPMVAWLTTRLDWEMDGDQEWLDRVETASRWPNFRIYPNNLLEAKYATDLGARPTFSDYLPGTGIPSDYWRAAFREGPQAPHPTNDSELVVPISVRIQECLLDPLLERGIKATTYPRNRYGGPFALTNRIVVHVPYQSNTMSIFENLHQRVIYVLPTLRLFRQIGTTCGAHIEKVDAARFSDDDMMRYMDWWRTDLQHLFFYFDSYDDLREGSVLRRTIEMQADAKRAAIGAFMLKQRSMALAKWEDILFTNWSRGNENMDDRPGCNA